MSKKNSKCDIGGKFNLVEFNEHEDFFWPVQGLVDNKSVEPISYGKRLVPEFKQVYIKKVIFSGNATVVFWSDNTKTVVKCSSRDEYSPIAGLSIACLKKIMGGYEVKRLFKDWLDYDKAYDETIYSFQRTLSDIRKEHREKEDE